MNQLEQLKAMTQVVADTGDIEAIKRYTPEDATTNPSLLLKAASMPQYQDLLDQACKFGKQEDQTGRTVEYAATRFAVLIGQEISSIVPGYISTEVDARLSFDQDATLNKAHDIIAQYEALGIDRSRILIKIAATWEGITSAKVLEQEGIQCNLTLLFNLTQAVACANAEVTLISPFVGRILDWHKANTGNGPFDSSNDPGVLSVRRIFEYYKHYDYKTIVMGASFRNIGQIQALAGCDRLTISPTLLQALADDTNPLTQALDKTAISHPPEHIELNEASFRFSMNEDTMASTKLAEGIRQFVKDQRALEALIEERIRA